MSINFINVDKRINWPLKWPVYCLLFCLSFLYTSSLFATITTVASEQSGTTIGIIEHVGAGTAASRNNNCGSISPTVPNGNVGDLLIAVAVIRENTTNVTMAGWNLYYSGYHGVDGNQDVGGYIFWRVATDTGGGGSADASNIVSTSTGAPANCRSLRGQISRFDGVDTSAMPGSAFEPNPIAAGNSSTQNTANVTTGTNTTTVATAMSIAVTFINDNATVTEGDGFSESFDFTSNGGRDSSMSLNYRQEVSTGTKGAFTWPQNLGTDESIGVLFALKPDNTIEGIGINVPSGTSTDDVMIAAIAVGPSTTGITAPAGWTLINRVDQATATSNSQAVYYRVATSTEPGAYVWTFSGGAINGTAGGIVTYNGVDTSSPIDASGGNTTASSTTHQANSINTTVVNTMIVSTHSFSSSETWTPPAGMTEQVDVASMTTPNAAGISLEMSDVLQAAIGATGNKTATAAGNADTGVGQLIALTPLVINENITISFAGGNVDDVVAGSISLTDAALGTPELFASSTNGVGAAAITTNIGPTISTNALLIDIVGKPRGNGSYTPGTGQTERFDIERQGNNNGLTGAMSTKAYSAASDSLTQTHSSATRQNAHAVVSVAPSASTTTYDADASRTAGNTTGFSWTHTFTTSNFVNAKLVVGVTYRDAAACGTVSVSGLTIGGLPFIQITSTSVTDTDSGDCIYADLWYVDLNNIILSTNNNSNLGGQAIDQDEALEYEGLSDTASLFIDDAIFANNERLDAIHYLDNGNVAISISSNNGASVGGTTFEEDDIVEVTTSGTFVQELFSEDNFTSAEDNARDIDAVYIRDNGDIVLSTVGTETLPACGGGSLTVTDDDIVEWDVSMSCATLVVAFAPLLSGGGDEDIVGLHYLNDDPNMMLISILNNQTLDSQAFTDGDVILYDRNTSTAYLYMDEGNFTANEDIDALTLTINPVTTPTIDHYDIDFSSATGITCLPVSVTITAKDNTNTTVNHTADTTIDFNVSTNLGQWATTPSSGTGTITDPTPGTPDNGDAQYEFPSGESSVTIPLSYTEFAVAGNSETFEIDITTTPDEDGGIADANDDPTVTFEFTAIIFNNVDDGNNTITTQISGKPSDTGFNSKTYNLQVLNADEDDPSVCQSIFGNGDVVNIDLGAECKNPNTCAGNELNIDNINPGLPAAGVDISTSDDDGVATTVASYEPGGVDLEFGANAAAEIVLTYPDAGSLELHARYELLLDDGVTGSGEYATGISNAFVVRPFGFDIDSSGQRAADWLDNNALDDSTTMNASFAADATGSAFASAGHSTNTFSVTIRAVSWDSSETEDGNNDGVPDTGVNLTNNSTTPNFGQETSTELVDVTAGNVQPTNVGTLFFGDNLDFTGSSGSLSTNLAFDEVGIIDLTAALDSGDYLGGGQDSTSTHQNFGRFTPDRFTLADNTPTLENGCAAGNFTYMEEPFYFGSGNEPAITITAVNEAGGTTVNYGDGGSAATDFWKLPTALDRAYDDNGVNNGTTFTDLAVASVIASGDDNFDGIGVFTLSNTSLDRDSFMFDRASVDLNAAEGSPFTASIDLLIRVTAGSLTDTDGICYDGDGDGTCETDGSDDYTVLTDSGGTALSLNQLRFGRFSIGTAVGSELLTLSPTSVIQYFDGSGFITNTDDTCTAINLVDHIRLDNTGTVVAGNSAMTIGSGTSSISTFNDPVAAGDTATTFSAPGEGNTGYVDIFGNLGCNDVTVACAGSTTFDYLRFDWNDDDGNDDGPYDDEPFGRVDFGLFEGPRQFIYIREPW